MLGGGCGAAGWLALVRARARTHAGKEGKALVPVDGVGGAAILIRGSLHREGVLFPAFPFNHAVGGLSPPIPQVARIS
jgi:hypothetical protein